MTAKTFLLVDDDEEDIEMMVEALKELDTETNIVVSTNSYDALENLQQKKVVPDFIFLDLNMPRLNGKQCLKKIKENGALKDIPVIIYSTSKLDEDKDTCLGLGASCFLVKPNSFRALINTLGLIVEKQWQLL